MNKECESTLKLHILPYFSTQLQSFYTYFTTYSKCTWQFMETINHKKFSSSFYLNLLKNLKLQTDPVNHTSCYALHLPPFLHSLYSKKHFLNDLATHQNGTQKSRFFQNRLTFVSASRFKDPPYTVITASSRTSFSKFIYKWYLSA